MPTNAVTLGHSQPYLQFEQLTKISQDCNIFIDKSDELKKCS